MKARIRFYNGEWWCRRLGFIGWGATPQEAYDATWPDYFEAIRPAVSRPLWGAA